MLPSIAAVTTAAVACASMKLAYTNFRDLAACGDIHCANIRLNHQNKECRRRLYTFLNHNCALMPTRPLQIYPSNLN